MSLFSSPLDYSRGAGRAPAQRPDAVDVIIPIYGAAAALRRCLASVAAQTDTRHGVILVIDGPQDADVESAIADFPFARVLRNATRLGFAGSVNRGMRASQRDVVLLNSDTIVTPRWMEKLIDAAYSHGDVGTVTPLSNHATLCSVPRAFEENLLPRGHDAASFAALIEQCSARTYPRIPTGVGVCLYIRRALLADIGLFDAIRFPLGYGEENDFCFRALARGWVHVADDATFIEHAGHASFGAARANLLHDARAMLRRLHPRYLPTIAAHMKHDTLAPVRARIEAALCGNGRLGRPEQHDGRGRPLLHRSRRVVHVVHGWPPFANGGTEQYAAWLVREQKLSCDVAVYARIDGEAVEWMDDGVRVRLVSNRFTARNPLRRNALRDPSMERDFARFLESERPDLVHIHHLAGHVFSLAGVAKRLGIPIVQQIQDWWFLCARINQLDRDGQRCTGPGLEKCARCATLTRVPPAALTNRALHALRRSAARAAIEAAEVCVAGSNAIRDDYVRAGITTPIRVIPYGIDITPLPRSQARLPIRFGCVGAILPHKGVHTAVEAMRDFAPHEAELHLWGNLAAAPEYVETLRSTNVVFEGTFREEDKPRVFASMDVLLVPSIGLESFGIAAREAMACGVPVIATAGAALDEIESAELFPAADAVALRRILRRCVDDPTLIDRWSARLPAQKRSDLHAAEIERVYESVLKR